MNYLEFFGLKEDPFKINPDPDYFFETLTHRKALNLLWYTLESKESFGVIIGEPGTGKTTILKKFLKSLPNKYTTAVILNPFLSPEEFLKTLLDEFKIEYDEKSLKNEMLKKIYTFLEEQLSNGKKVLVVIDEAQLLPDETLEEIRLLSNLETDKEKLIQFILVGQPEFEEKLLNPKLRQLNNRISNKYFLEPLSKEEVEKYINHRLKIVDFKEIKFDKSVIDEIYSKSKGIPRLINLIASRSLMVAFLKKKTVIEKEDILKSLTALNQDVFEDAEKSSNIKVYLTFFLILTAIFMVLWYIFSILKNIIGV